MKRRGQRGRLPLGLCAATFLGPLGGDLAAEYYASPGEKDGGWGPLEFLPNTILYPRRGSAA